MSARLRHVGEGRQPQEEVSERVAAELTRAEDKLTKVRWLRQNSPDQNSRGVERQHQSASCDGPLSSKVVGELRRRRTRDSSLISADTGKACTIAEIEKREGMVIGMIAQVQTHDVKLDQRVSALMEIGPER